MCNRVPFAGILGLLAVALLAVNCRDSTEPGPQALGGPDLAITTGAHPGIDKFNGTLNQSGTRLFKGFNPTNPKLGSAIVVTFFWLGSHNIITGVFDHLTDDTPVGNTYHLVKYVTAGGISMATYVATNVQNFPDPNPNSNKVLVVDANLSEPITDGGLILSTYSGVEPVYEQAMGAHVSATGTGSSATDAYTGAIAANSGALVYGVTLSDGVAGLEGPAGYSAVSTLSDASLKADARYTVQATADSLDPEWTWFFNSQSTWLATVLTLNRAPGASLTLDGTLNESGSTLEQGFIPTNPHVGDAIIATFFWLGSTNVIDSVTDRLSDGTPVGNTYHLVEYVTAGGISMGTYVATNAGNFPDPNQGTNDVLVVEAHLCAPVTDGGVMVSAYSGVKLAYGQALGAHHSGSGHGSSLTIARPGPIQVEAGELAYGVTLSNGVVGLEGPSGFDHITTMSDAAIKSAGEYTVRGRRGAVNPEWSWYFNSRSTWLASVLSLKPE